MVSGRAAAALGARLLLAARRRADLARRRRSSPTTTRDYGIGATRRRAVHRTALARRARRRSRPRASRRTRTSGTTSGASGGCRSNVDPLDVEARRRRGARAAGARLRAGARQRRSATCCRCSARTSRRRPRWVSGAVVPARRAPVPDPRRLADGLPPAARLAAVGGAGGRSAASIDADPFAPRAAAAARQLAASAVAARRTRRAAPPIRAAARRRTAAARSRRRGRRIGRLASCARRSASSRATAGCTSSCRRSQTLEDYLELVAAVEETAARARACRCVIEGYAPPRDPRLEPLQGHARPRRDRGQHPPGARAGTSSSSSTTTLYEEARQTRLGTEKFMLDGRHTGTGGGNHVVARRRRRRPTARSCAGPICCAACSRYWHNHPSLSYLFSGLFIGPTSQAPRVDEARNDALYELEIAFRQMPEPRRLPPPWLVDRVFRNLLVDVTGNTHRAEFCIDKLYSPGRGDAAGAGCVELRAFEMPPHARMSLRAAAAAARAGRAVLERRRTSSELVRWGTELHDRFMLPHFVGAGLRRRARRAAARPAIAFEPEWFAPHFEFRFPLLGAVARGGVARRAAAGARAVARAGRGAGRRRHGRATSTRRSSGCRSRCTGLTDARHVVACNGRARAAAADRHAPASSSPACATAPGSRRAACTRRSRVHAPLVVRPRRHLERAARSAAAPTTSRIRAAAATRPSRSTPTRPRAGAWRASSRIGHTPGRMDVAPPKSAIPEFPFTLDLRRAPDGQRDRIAACQRMSSPCADTPRTARAVAPPRGVRSPPPGVYDEMLAGAGRAARRTGEPFVALARGDRPARARRRAGSNAQRDRSARTASPTTSTATRRASTGRGSSTRCRSLIVRRRVEPARGRRSPSARALLNLILADLYGPQRLLRDGLLPPELVFAQPGFLRPCHGVAGAAAACYLHLLRRRPRRARPTARWWVLADRTQAPSGAGYALENRIVALAHAARGVPRLPRAAARRASSARCATRSRALAPAQPRRTRASCC